MIAQQPGVTLQDNEIHIRGGRADDTMFVVDGTERERPAGRRRLRLPDRSVHHQRDRGADRRLQRRVRPGGQRRGATSRPRRAATAWRAGSACKRDYVTNTADKKDPVDWRDLTTFDEPHNIDIVKASLSGPDPISAGLRALGLDLPGKQYMLVSGSMDIRDGYLPIYSRQRDLESPVYPGSFWSPRQQNDWNGLLKWTWNITPAHKLNINTSRQVAISQGFTLPGEGYPRPFMDRPGRLPRLHQREHPDPGLLPAGAGRDVVVRADGRPQLQPHARQRQRQRRLHHLPAAAGLPAFAAQRPGLLPRRPLARPLHRVLDRQGRLLVHGRRCQPVQDRVRALVHRDAAGGPAGLPGQPAAGQAGRQRGHLHRPPDHRCGLLPGHGATTAA